MDRLPMVVAGMCPAEKLEFTNWLRDVCGAEFDELSFDRLKAAALAWYDDQAQDEYEY